MGGHNLKKVNAFLAPRDYIYPFLSEISVREALD